MRPAGRREQKTGLVFLTCLLCFFYLAGAVSGAASDRAEMNASCYVLEPKAEFFLLERENQIEAGATHALEIDKNGRLLVLDPAGSALLIFEPNGLLSRTVILNGPDGRPLISPNGISLVDGSRFITSSPLGGQFYLYDNSGRLRMSVNPAESSLLRGRIKNLDLKRYELSKNRLYLDLASGTVILTDLEDRVAGRARMEGIDEKTFVYEGGSGKLFLVRPSINTISLLKVDGESRLCEEQVFQGKRIIELAGGGYATVDPERYTLVIYDENGREISRLGNIQGEISGNIHPVDIALGREGELFVLDDRNYAVVVYAQDGTRKREFGSYGSYPGRMKKPVGIVSDSIGRVIVRDAERKCAISWTPGGSLMEEWESLTGQEGILGIHFFIDTHKKIHVIDFRTKLAFTFPLLTGYVRSLNDLLNMRKEILPDRTTLGVNGCLIFFNYGRSYFLKLSPGGMAEKIEVPLFESVTDEEETMKFEPRVTVSRNGKEFFFIDRRLGLVRFELGGAARVVRLPSEIVLEDRLDMDGRGRIVMVDGKNKRLLVLNPQGGIITSLGARGDGLFEFRDITALDVTEDGLIAVLDSVRKKIVVFSSSLSPVLSMKLPEKFVPVSLAGRNNEFYLLASREGALYVVKYILRDYYALGLKLYRDGLYREAARYLSIVEERLDSPDALFALGDCQRKLGDDKRAKRTFELLKEKFPSSRARRELEYLR